VQVAVNSTKENLNQPNTHDKRNTNSPICPKDPVSYELCIPRIRVCQERADGWVNRAGHLSVDDQLLVAKGPAGGEETGALPYPTPTEWRALSPASVRMTASRPRDHPYAAALPCTSSDLVDSNPRSHAYQTVARSGYPVIFARWSRLSPALRGLSGVSPPRLAAFRKHTPQTRPRNLSRSARWH